MKKWRPFVALDLPDADVMDTDRKPWGISRDIGPNPGLLVLLGILLTAPLVFLLRSARRGEAANILHKARGDEAADGPYRPTRLDRNVFGRVFSGGEWDDRSQLEKPAKTRKQAKPAAPQPRVVEHQRSSRKTRRPSVISR